LNERYDVYHTHFLRVNLYTTMMEVGELNILEQETLREYIKDKYVYEKVINYFSRHELIGEEIFPYLGEIGKGFVVHLGERYSYNPVMKDVFIRRIPFYFYKPDKDSHHIGDLNQYIMGIL